MKLRIVKITNINGSIFKIQRAWQILFWEIWKDWPYRYFWDLWEGLGHVDPIYALTREQGILRVPRHFEHEEEAVSFLKNFICLLNKQPHEEVISYWKYDDKNGSTILGKPLTHNPYRNPE
jgi:hypothetical protein